MRDDPTLPPTRVAARGARCGRNDGIRALLFTAALAAWACDGGDREPTPDTPPVTEQPLMETDTVRATDGLIVDEPVRAVPHPPRDPDAAPDSVALRMLVDVQEVDATIRVEARYATGDNFTGAPLPGYEANRALLRREAARALAGAQERLREDGLALMVWDGYRPARATRAMAEWAERTGREDLLNGWIARRSRHNLGLAVDATLVRLDTGEPLDMGTDFDTFTREAYTANATGQVAENRRRLVRAMEAEGFTNYFREWWHFDYRAPDPLRFDVPIR